MSNILRLAGRLFSAPHPLNPESATCSFGLDRNGKLAWSEKCEDKLSFHYIQLFDSVLEGSRYVPKLRLSSFVWNGSLKKDATNFLTLSLDIHMPFVSVSHGALKQPGADGTRNYYGQFVFELN